MKLCSELQSLAELLRFKAEKLDFNPYRDYSRQPPGVTYKHFSVHVTYEGRSMTFTMSCSDGPPDAAAITLYLLDDVRALLAPWSEADTTFEQRFLHTTSERNATAWAGVLGDKFQLVVDYLNK